MTEFYVGYHDPAPPKLARFLRLAVAAVLALGVAAAVVAALSQRSLPAAAFEFGTARTLQGTVVADPYPALIVERGALSSRYLLVGPGKRGADELVAGVTGERASLRGTLAYREGQVLVEVVPGSVVPLDDEDDGETRPVGAGGRTEAGGLSGHPAEPAEPLGERYVEGEIVGSKCYLGVMNPGSGVTHRACATLCIQGGVPPLLHVRLANGDTEGLVLTGTEGEPLGADQLRGLIASPVGMSGNVVRRGAYRYLQVDPGQIRRLR